MPLFNHPLLALIPARGGSKGVLRKNLREVAGRPLIHFSLQAALGVTKIDSVTVSSEDDEILNYAEKMKVNVLKRPLEFASDTASAADVVKHFIGTLANELLQQNPYILYLQPTSPLRSEFHINEALDLMEAHSAKGLMSVTELNQSPFKSFLINAEGRLESLFEERLSNTRRQDLPPVYAANGAIYVFQISDFQERSGFPSNGSLPYVMNSIDSLDIDTEGDMQALRKILEESYV